MRRDNKVMDVKFYYMLFMTTTYWHQIMREKSNRLSYAILLLTPSPPLTYISIKLSWKRWHRDNFRNKSRYWRHAERNCENLHPLYDHFIYKFYGGGWGVSLSDHWILLEGGNIFKRNVIESKVNENEWTLT